MEGRELLNNQRGRGRLVPLNLIYDYPVQWSKYKVLRDLIQNFYDSIGQKKWAQDFDYYQHNNQLVMRTPGEGFDFHWLLHIGASTKRRDPGKYAGFFGEGFKMASLCALRDYHWKILMKSRDWFLEVTTHEIEIDGESLTSLAYRIWDRQKIASDTELILYPFSEGEMALFYSALYSFYYVENPLFGEKIWETEEGAIFLRSSKKKPSFYPITSQYDGEGILFAKYQAMGSFPLSLIFCSHTSHISDRERNSFYRMDVISLISSITSMVPPEVARRVLIYLRRFWYSFPSKKYDFKTWHGIVKNLARSLATSREEVIIFKEEFPHLLVAPKVKEKEIISYNRRKQALSWMRSFNQDERNNRKYRLVQEGFLHLQYPTLEEKCQEEGGFMMIRDPAGVERELIGLLENFTQLAFSGFWGLEELPCCKVIENLEASWGGVSNCIPLKEKKKNYRGMIIRYSITYVALKRVLFSPNLFSQALSTYLHELAHVFGGDRSEGFSYALTIILESLLYRPSEILSLRQEWDTIWKRG